MNKHCPSRNVTSQDWWHGSLVLWYPSNLISSTANWCILFLLDIPKQSSLEYLGPVILIARWEYSSAEDDVIVKQSLQYNYGFIGCLPVAPSCWNHRSWRLRRWITKGLMNILSMCRYLSPLTVSVKSSAFSKKYESIMRSHIIAHRIVTSCGCNSSSFKIL